MLKDIMKSIKKNGYISKSMLAGELNTSEDMIDEGIDQLLRMGYIINEEKIILNTLIELAGRYIRKILDG